MKNKKILAFIGVLLALAIISPVYLVSKNLPPLGDGGAIALSVESLNSGEKIDYINGPLYFAYISSVVNAVTGIYSFLPLLFGFMIFFAVFLFSLKITKSHLFSMLIGVFSLALPYTILYSSTFFMETAVIFFMILTLYSNYKFIESKKINWLILTGIFLGISVSLKQTAYLLLAIIPLQNLLFLNNDSFSLRIKNIIKIICVSLLIIIPFLGQFYIITGTFLEPNNPLWTSAQVNEQSTNYLNSFNFSQSHLGSHISQISLEKIASTYNPSLYYYVNYSIPEAFFAALLIFGSIIFLKERKKEFVYLSIFFITYHLFLILVRVQRYVIHSKILILIILFMPLIFYSNRKGKFNKKLSIVLLSLLLIFFIPLYIEGINFAKEREYTMCWNPSGNSSIYNLIEAYSWINYNAEKDILIADPCRNEAVYYAKRDTYWLNYFKDPSLYFAVREHNRQKVSALAETEKIKYIVILQNLISNNNNLNTPQFLTKEDSNFLDENFELVFFKQGVSVYRLY